MAGSVSADAYVDALAPLIARVSEQTPAVEKAADLVVASVRDDGVLQTFGSGHSAAP